MSNTTPSHAIIFASRYAARVLRNDALKKGAAAGFAGIIVALVTEAMWPAS